MLRTPILVPGLALLALSLTGCPQYYAADDACVESGRVSGGSSLAPVPKAAFNRINCYRRLSGLTVAIANELVQVAAEGHVNYIAQNPNLDYIADSSKAENDYLTQFFDDPGFTGSNYYERLTNTETGAGYTFYDVGGTGVWEYVRIETDAADGTPAPSGEAAIDFLMRDPEFRQLALQPSWIDGAYAEYALTPQWYEQGEWTAKTAGAPLPTGGRAYYMIVLYTAPHIEHADKPVFLPRPDQTDVPLFGPSRNQNGMANDLGQPPVVHLSYPVTFLVGALDPSNYDPINQNQYNTEIAAASIVGPEGPLEIEVLHPGDPPEDVWPAAYFQRTIFALYAREPFQPRTLYTVYADMSHPEGDFAIEYSFTTRAEDPGVDPNIGRTPVQTSPATP